MAAWNVGLGSLQGHDQALDRHLIEHHRARLLRQLGDVVEREQHALERLGLVGPHLGEAFQHVVGLRLVEAVQDVGDAGVRAGRRGGHEQVLAQRALHGACTASSATSLMPSIRHSSSLRISAGNVRRPWRRAPDSTRDRMIATVCGCSLPR